MAEKEGDRPLKRRRIHLALAESVALSQSEEGSASLRGPVDRRHPAASTSMDRNMEPRYRGRTRKQFQPPRRINSQPQEEESSSSASTIPKDQSAGDKNVSGNKAKKGHERSIVPLSSGNNSDQFESENEEVEKEMVEQSSNQSIYLLSVLGGFSSAAAVQQESASTSFNSFSDSAPGKNSIGKGWLRATKKETGASPRSGSYSQSLLPSFVSGTSNKPSVQSQPPGGNDRNKFEALSSSPAEKIVYGTPSKMYSPIKQVSDNVYVISDESSPESSQKKVSGRIDFGSDQTKSVAKNLFGPSTAKTSSSARGASSSKLESGGNRKISSSLKRTASAAASNGGMKGKHKMDPSQRTFSSAPTTLCLGKRPTPVPVVKQEAVFIDDDSDSPASVPVFKQEIEAGKTFGLLNDSKVTMTKHNYFEKLPMEIMENIFCGLPMLDLCLNVNRVCLAWNDVISSAKFIPWKKTYHKVKVGEKDTRQMVNQIIEEEGMTTVSSRLVKLLSYMGKFKRISPSNNACELLKQHPKYTWALALLKEKADDEAKNEEVNPWSLMCAMVLVSSTVHDLHTALQLLTSARSHLLCLEVLECFYCIATFLLSFKLRHEIAVGYYQTTGECALNVTNAAISSVVRGLHYRLFYALYLYENTSVSDHSMLQEAMGSSSGQQSIVRYSRGDTKVRLTHEQMRIVKYIPDVDRGTGEVIKIFAFAGTGKTTTLVRYAQMRPNLKFLLIVFNKAVCDHAQATFPHNVTCKTGHGLAFGFAGCRYAAQNQLNAGNPRVFDVAMALEKRKEHKENLYIRAKFVMETLKKYLSSDDEEITYHHVPTTRKGDHDQMECIPDDARRHYAVDATHYWNKMKNLQDATVRMTHDGYLKLFQLSKPRLKPYDIILVDEAQDLTPALLDIVQHQTQPRIFVGDQHQQIYAFRGAVNAMQGVQADQVFYLTQSFRFGPEISQVANTMLETLKVEQIKNIVGHANPDVINGERKGQLAVLCRSNYTVFTEAVAICVYSDQPVRVAFIGGTTGFGFPMLRDIYSLMLSPSDRMKEENRIKNPFIARFTNLADLEKYAEKTLDQELHGKIRIVRTCQHNLPMFLAKISQKAIGNPMQADIVFSTVHKAKGLEFSTVKVTDDFIDFSRFPLTPNSKCIKMVTEEECNLLYVAVTRAKHALIMSPTIRIMLSKMGGGCYQPTLTEKLKRDGVEMKCLATKQEFTPAALTLYRPAITLSNKQMISAGVCSPELLTEFHSEYSCLCGMKKDDDFSQDSDDVDFPRYARF